MGIKVRIGNMPEYTDFIDFLREKDAFCNERRAPNSKRHYILYFQASNVISCTKFQELGTGERKTIVAKAMLCFNCLKSKHRVADCQSDQTCKIRGCGRKHHSMLHPVDTQQESIQQQTIVPKPADQVEPTEEGVSKPKATTLCGSVGGVKRQVLLSTAEVLMVGRDGITIKSRALLDSGSDSNIVTEKLAAKLKLQMQHVDLPISGLNNIQTRVKYIVSTSIISCVNQFSSSILDFLVVPKVTSNLPVTDVEYRSWPLPPSIKLADPTFHTPGEIDLIIGNEIFFDLIKQGRLRLGNETTLTETELGWIVGGSVRTRKSKSSARVCQMSHHDDMLNKTMRQFWEIENVDADSNMSVTEVLVEEHYIKTHSREENGRYIVRLPFNECKKELGDSYEIANRRLDKLLITLAKDPLKREQYFRFMAEYRSLGHMEEINETTRDGYYLPHHAVFKTASSTTKIRVVFDGSARTTTGLSLNDIVCVGPTVQSDLLSIILRFCSHPIVLTADIPKMYRQVMLHKDDRKYQKILWIDDNGMRKVYELKTVTYGVASSPHHATRTLVQLATDDGGAFPLAEQVIRNDSYIDDFLTGGESAEVVVNIYKELSSLLQRGGFGVHKFCTNDPIIRQLQLRGYSNDASTTKRQVLSDIGRLFDPLGFLGPIITSAKLVMQDIWRLGLNWDEELPKEVLQEWIQFRRQLPIVNQMHKERCVVPRDTARVELHGYSDASKRAYGAVVYTRCIALDGTISVKLIATNNPADVISRGALPEELLYNVLWWKGSPNLQQAMPRMDEPEMIAEIPELRSRTVLAAVGGDDSIPLNRVSDYRKLLRSWAYVMRFIAIVRFKKREVSNISATEMANAERVIFSVVQGQVFGDLLKKLQEESMIRHSLSNLALFIGQDGLIRVGGLLKYSAIPYDGRHQVLLPERHHVTVSLIRKLHEEHHHVGQGGLLAIVRECYWPLRAKSIIKRIISGCQTCAKYRPNISSQFMGNLPEHRVNQAPVFSRVGGQRSIYTTFKHVKNGMARYVTSALEHWLCWSMRTFPHSSGVEEELWLFILVTMVRFE
ncbi:uncharacterized protein LOC134206658 [Armigeres subalbatus]|uniref:uncharacterized protein LOC134206658 n=1 Tax=Armigeres subalbatus TaxID=124917 RepID=UPI002ED5CA3D